MSEQYRIEWIPNTPAAIRDALARGGRLLPNRTQGQPSADRNIVKIDVGTVADALSNAGLIAVAFGVVKEIARKAKSATKAARELYVEAKKFAEVVQKSEAKKKATKKTRKKASELKADDAAKTKKSTAAKKKKKKSKR